MTRRGEPTGAPSRAVRGTTHPTWRLAERLLGADLAEEVLGDLLEQATAEELAEAEQRPATTHRLLPLRALALAVSFRFRAGADALRTRTRRAVTGEDRLRAARVSRPESHDPSENRTMSESMNASKPIPTTTKRRTGPISPSRLLAAGGGALQSVATDARQTARSLRRTPVLGLAVLLTLTLGVGATTAMYTVVRGVLLEPLPFADAERLVRVGTDPATIAHIEQFRTLDSVDTVTAVGADGMVLQHEGVAVRLRGLLVDADHHRVFGVQPTLGRGFEPGDDLPGAEPVVVLGHDTWTDYFGADPEIVGETVALSGFGMARFRVIGVQGRGYEPVPWTADFLVPHRYEEGGHDWRDMARFWAVGRAGTSADRVQTEARAMVLRNAESGGVFNRQTADDLQVVGLLDARVGSVRQSLWLLLGVVVLVLLIGCANVANLLLVRGMSRRDEFALRLALGAGRARVARQLVTEGLILALVGGAMGVALAAISLPNILERLPQNLPRAGEISLDLGVLAFAFVVSCAVGVLFGLTPMLRLSAGRGATGSRRSTAARSSRRFHDLLVAGQLAMTMVLLAGGGLLVRSMVELQRVDPGIDIEGVVSYRLSPPEDRYPEEARVAYFERLEEALLGVPGVTSVGAITNLPLTPAGMGVGISPDGAPVPEGDRPMAVSYRAVSPGYLSTAGVTLLRGRNLTEADRSGAPPVGLINQSMAEKLWPNDDPIGRRVAWNTGDTWFEVVGVVGDVHQRDLATASLAEAYVPYAQEAWVPAMYILARTTPQASPESLRAALRAVDPLIPITDERPMTEVLSRSMAKATFNAKFFSGFALLGLLLSAVGVYGVTLYVISQRTSELGIRMALGADHRSIVGQVLRGNLPSVGLGMGAGLLGAWLVSRSLASLLYSIEPGDPLTLALAGIALGGGAMAVSAMAARRVGRLAPSSVLTKA